MPILTQPPDPNPKTPRFVCPPGSVDTHIHLIGPSDRYAFDPTSYYVSADALPETHIALMATLGLSAAVLVSPGGYGRDTRLLADVLARHPDRYRGIALVPEDITDAEIDRLNTLGVRGVRFMSGSRGGVLPTISEAVAARVAAHGWHVQFYPHGADIDDFADRLLALPNTIVLDHFASVKAERGVDQPAMRTLKRMLDTGRVWIKLSGPMRCVPGDFPYAAVTPIARALVAHAPERLVWGSDWPHLNMDGRGMPNDGDLVDLIPEWIEDAADRRAILVDNPARLYGFPTRG
ncbi:amidohydrolase family protein [Rhodoplanes sp. TEM]|uniref:Amidohydrolase family protein n=1 Tax=Rhodoplanes tepidamans TaxID=200616 RepID=A0ABT5JCX6_RHOTP|nr:MULTISPECIES: amidohydrolase family protein [Rhodoplanes]MDC7787308.1 amidohydrolase family protein [Rhodoplanes tepidamans]MDC7986902.1 amidohydrolase family protein [Rhodoplanes sp. TEM]MDQ0358219.1 putative TIM-barrel fold metal-dependent hydrolase [Rhodoplanes tepidamans]